MPPFEPRLTVLMAALSLCLAMPAGAQEQRFGFGEPANPEQIAGWDIDARPPGVGLPEGSGSVADGREIYAQVCAACHGEDGQGPMDRLVGGVGTLDTEKPVKTVGSYWPYAATLFDYVRRAMPFDNPQSLTPDDVYAATAFVLYMNDIVPEDTVMNAETLPKVEMPNRDGFYGPDPRPGHPQLALHAELRGPVPGGRRGGGADAIGDSVGSGIIAGGAFGFLILRPSTSSG